MLLSIHFYYADRLHHIKSNIKFYSFMFRLMLREGSFAFVQYRFRLVDIKPMIIRDSTDNESTFLSTRMMKQAALISVPEDFHSRVDDVP